MNIEEQLFSIEPKTRNLLRRSGFLKPIVQFLIFEQLTKDLEPPKEIKEKGLKDFCNAKDLINKTKLMAYLEDQYLNYNELLEKISIPFKKQYYSLQKFGSKAESHFLKRKDALDKVIYSLIRVKNKDVAYDLYLRLEEKTSDFTSLGYQYSEGPEKNTNGTIGPISLANISPAIKELFENNKIGEVLEPVFIDNWWVVIRLEKRIDAVFDDAMKMLMACELFEDWLQNESNNVIKAFLINKA